MGYYESLVMHPVKPHRRCRLVRAIELLESRRLLSAAAAPQPEWTEGISRLISMSRSPAAIYDPSQDFQCGPGVQAAGVVGGTAATTRQVAGALSGKIVYTVGGHGFVSDNANGWHTQRPNLLGMVEGVPLGIPWMGARFAGIPTFGNCLLP